MPSTCIWRGDAPTVAQVDTVVIGGVWLLSDTATITINGKNVTFVVGGATAISDVVAGLVAAWNASTVFEHAELTASDASPNVLLTADTQGVPFTASVSKSSVGGTITTSTTTANAGPNDVTTAANWSTGAVPVTGDTVILEVVDSDLLYGLDQNAVTLASRIIRPSFTGSIGLSEQNGRGYKEYRTTYWKISATSDDVDSGSPRTKLNVGSAQTTLHIRGSSGSSTADPEPVLWVGTHANNVVTVAGGYVGIAIQQGETATVSVLTKTNSSSNVRCGSGVTLGTLNLAAGKAVLRCDATLVTQTGGTLYYEENNPTALNVLGGTCCYTSPTTAPAIVVGGGGILDFRWDGRARTVSACAIYKGATICDPLWTVVWTTGIDLVQCGIKDVTLDLGTNQTVTPSAI